MKKLKKKEKEITAIKEKNRGKTFISPFLIIHV